ncbi:FAD-binding oxidoreductase [Aureimonas altamirensis]|uniref:FAD-binding oxidoreductase n=1 Tax=Aureimonas altamirensis TaxID=370622 RepID=UPI003D816AAF
MREALDELLACLGPAGCLAGPDVPAASRTDESRTGHHLPAALLRPASVDQLSRAMAICHRHKLRIVPQGGMTGLAGGANPSPGDVAVSLARFHGVEAVDRQAATMCVRAGTVLAVAQEAAEDAGFVFPIDYGARGSCQIGGLVATNAGGPRVIRYGTTRSNVLGLEVVLADGTVLSHLGGQLKDNTGYDLKSLFVGSEGTLGVVTRAVFRLWPKPAETYTALCALPDATAATALLAAARSAVTVSAYEALWPAYYDIGCRLAKTRPFDATPAVCVLIEAEQPLEALLATAFEEGLVEDALMARSCADARAFWAVREAAGLDDALPGLMNFDVSVELQAMPTFVDGMAAAIENAFPGTRSLFFGHMGDGNLHLILHRDAMDAGTAHALDDLVYERVRREGGSVSAEHGIGTLKRDWLGFSRSPAEIQAMHAIKSALDPDGVMNPGKLLPRRSGLRVDLRTEST